jgi:hypothetical protein
MQNRLSRANTRRLLDQANVLKDNLEQLIEAQCEAELKSADALTYEQARAELIKEYGSAEKLDAVVRTIVDPAEMN